MRALAVAAALLLGLELVTRFYLFDASKDLSRFRSYPARASRLARADGFRLALVGNSATEEGVDAERLGAELSRALGRSVAADEFTADSSHLVTWRWMIERYFWAPEERADLVVLPFFGASLADGNADEIGRLAQFFTTVADWPEVMRADLHQLPDRLDFALSAVWATYAVRDRIEQRLFTALLPGYRDYVPWQDAGVRLRAPSRPRAQSFARLDGVMALADRRGTPLCFVAVPTRDSAVDAAFAAPALRHLAEVGACAIDLQDHLALGIGPEDFRDAIHLRERGRLVLTDRLGSELAPVVSEQLRGYAADGAGPYAGRGPR